MTPAGGEHAKRDREVVGRPGLANVRRREVDRDSVAGKLEPGVADGRANPIAAFADAGVRQAHHRENRQAERHIDLDDDGQGLDAENRRASEAGEHGSECCKFVSEGSMEKIPKTRYLWMQNFPER